MEAWLARCPLPIYSVRGNHDIADPWNFFSRTKEITGHLVRLTAGLWLAGMGWNGKEFYDLPKNDDLVSVCDHLKIQLRRYYRSDDRLVILSHYPANTELCEGYACIDELIAEFKPDVLFQGHMHEAFGKQTTLNWAEGLQTLVVNPGATGGILSLSTTEREVAFSPA
jgi:Icc-related predicted phosphoesterase